PERPVETSAVEPPPPTPVTEASTPVATNFLSGLAGMMKNPQMKEMIRAQQKMAMEQMYGGFFKNLNRPANEVDALKDLLDARQMALMDAGMSAMSGSEAERKQAAEQNK